MASKREPRPEADQGCIVEIVSALAASYLEIKRDWILQDSDHVLSPRETGELRIDDLPGQGKLFNAPRCPTLNETARGKGNG